MKKIIPFSLASVFAVAIAGSLILVPSKVKADKDESGLDENSKIQIGFAITPVRLNLQGKNPALVGLGSYIVNAQGGCNDCHSCPTYKPGHNPFPPPLGVLGDGRLNDSGHLAGGVPFQLPPPFNLVKSPNLTPDRNGKPEGSTFEEFVTTIRTGTDPEDRHRKLVVMPWPMLRLMTD